MNPPTFHDLASDYLAGFLSEPEAAAFESQLAQASAAERAQFAALQDAASLLILSEVPLLAAPVSVLPELLAKITPAPSIFTYVKHEDGWEPLPWPVPGATWKPLYVLPNGETTFLLKLLPGTDFPEHPHPGDEECFILEGDLINDGVTLRPGDYVRAKAGSHHDGLKTIGGCICLLVLRAAA